MALVLNFKICKNTKCDSLSFIETTGIYNAATNPTGYGSPNPTIQSSFTANDAVLIITDPEGTVFTIDITAGNDLSLSAITDNFPTQDNSQFYTITPTVLSQSGSFIDGVYEVKYTVKNLTGASGVIYSMNKFFLVSCGVDCCVSKMFGKIAECSCECDDSLIDNALLANVYLKGLYAAAACGQKDKANQLIKNINKLCGNTTSGCGCN